MSNDDLPSTPQAGADPRLRKRVLFIVFTTVFLDLVGFGIVIPLLPLYVTSMGATALTAGLILTSFAGTQALATPILGRLSDRHGRRKVILVSLAGNAASMVIFALATYYHVLWLLFASRILAGATAGNLAACQAAIADVTDKNDRAGAMGMIGAGISLGLILGPAAGALLSRFGTWVPPIGAAAMALLDAALAFVLMPETRKLRVAVEPAENSGPAPSLRDALADPPMVAVLLLYFLTFFAMTNTQVSLALLVKERLQWGATEVGYIFGLFGLTGLIVQGGLVGHLSKAFGEIRLVIMGAALNTAAMLVIAFAHHAAPLIAGLVLFGVGLGITNPVLATLASKLAREEQQGAMLGFAQASGGLARTIGPTWSGFLFSQLGSTAPFLSGAIAVSIAFLVALGLRGQTKVLAAS